MNLDMQDKFGLEQNLLDNLQQNTEKTLSVCIGVLKWLQKKNINISLTIVGNGKMQEINKKWRNINQTTNVLSLQNYTKVELEQTSLPEIALGDIFISWDKCLSEAQELLLTDKKYFIILFIHGFLHLLGYDHIEKDNEEHMLNLENTIVKELGFGEKGLIAGSVQ